MFLVKQFLTYKKKRQDFQSDIQEFVNNIDLDAITETLSDKVMQSCILQSAYCNFQATAIENLHAQYSSAPSFAQNSNSEQNPIVLQTDLEHSLDCFNSLQMEQPEDFSQSHHLTSPQMHSYTSVNEFLRTKSLSNDQLQALHNFGLLDDYSNQQKQTKKF